MRGALLSGNSISRHFSMLPSLVAPPFTLGRHRRSTSMAIQYRHPEFERYQNNITKYWDNFYKRHDNRFFKDRHYLEKDWGQYFCDESISPNGKVLLEVGCGAGNTIFPLLTTYPNLYVHACDLSTHAISLVKSHADFREDRINAFVCDVSSSDLYDKIKPSSIDVVTLIFMLSAVSPTKMVLILCTLKKVLKPDGVVLLRDYAVGDFSQVKLHNKNQMISKNFYVRGDNTCSFYFSEKFLSTLFMTAGFKPVHMSTYCKRIENRARHITMNRRWVRAIFRSVNHGVALES